MTLTLHNKKLGMHAAETAFHGTIAHLADGQLSGVRQVDGIDYEWRVGADSICVVYGEVTKCLDY